MAYIAVDVLGKYSEMSWGLHYALTIKCMFTSFVEIILIKDKKAETVITAYLKYVYTDKGGAKFIFNRKRWWILKWSDVSHCRSVGLHKIYLTLLT